MNPLDFFDGEGHLTDFALCELTDGEPAELSRLEAAEHLSFCDLCVSRYTELLCGGELLVPPEHAAPGVWRRIHGRARTIFLSRGLTMGVAACLTMVLWVNGAFTLSMPRSNERPLHHLTAITQTVTVQTAKFGQDITENINEFFENFDLKGVFQHEKK